MTDNIYQRLSAVLTCVTEPTEAQLAGIRDFLKKKYGVYDVDIEIVRDEAVISGFRLTVGSEVYDWSVQGRIAQLRESIRAGLSSSGAKDVIPLLRENIEDFEVRLLNEEVGSVTYVGDGIATVEGLNDAAYSEIVQFECGVRGMVQDIRLHDIGVVLFGSDEDIGEGSKVVRTRKNAGIGVGEGYLGRVVDALGAPIDGLGEIKTAGYRPVEEPAPGIIDRQGVNEPLATGLLVLDALFPIGRGQRELIVGDRQTGKTAIALDTIINQKGKDVICIYVAIGQKSSTVAKLVRTLKTRGAMDYTVVVNAPASDPAPLQYIAPYAGCAIGEYFMYGGRDVLIIYDDLSKHAVAYRTLSLLLGRSPGREAYPGDVFYLHSRLLERSARLSEEKGGGSMTALPIVETQAGDVSAYIPTNIISITDGQIYLESSLFSSGQRPAVNVGLSVSRVGGAAQTRAMKKAVGTLRLDLSQYGEMEVFTQFSSDLDEHTKRLLEYGSGLMALLRQEQYHPMSLHEQVITLVAAQNKVMLEIPAEMIKDFQRELLAHFDAKYADICREIDTEKVLGDETAARIAEAAKDYLKSSPAWSEHHG